jgi:hypothetical protein
MAERALLSTTVFGTFAVVLLVAAVVLAALGSFAYLASASVGMFFLAAALLSRAARSPRARVASVLMLAGLALVVFGLTATPFFYTGWGLIAGALAIALVGGLRH